MRAPNLTIHDARQLYDTFADQDGSDAVLAMAQIALWGKRQQIEGGRLRLLALRQLGRFLIRNGRGQGRPPKTSSADILPTLARLGITDRHISADAKSVARLVQEDFDDYLRQEGEPTLKGLLRFAERTRIGQPYSKGNATANIGPAVARSFLDPDDDTTTVVEWFTPPEIFEAMETDFDLDVCSPGAKSVPWIPARKHLTKRQNGLVANWSGFVWMNAPYGLRNGIVEWIEKFVAHGNGVAIVPDFTSTEWWHALTEQADIIMFVRPKIYFLPKREDGRSNSLGSTLVGMGARGMRALRNAERNGRGICFQRVARRRLVEAAACKTSGIGITPGRVGDMSDDEIIRRGPYAGLTRAEADLWSRFMRGQPMQPTLREYKEECALRRKERERQNASGIVS